MNNYQSIQKMNEIPELDGLRIQGMNDGCIANNKDSSVNEDDSKYDEGKD